MKQRDFGKTGLRVSPLGFGAGHIGGAELTEEGAGRLLNEALDLGIRLIDTARGYGLSEERIGRHLAGRRDEFVLSTKVGYRIAGYEDWTGPIIGAGVQSALKLLRTDHIDIVHLHSCPRHVLERGDVVDALLREVEAGRVRVAAYSGENDALDFAVQGGRFGSIQCSLNLCDQRSIDGAVRAALARGMGSIAKRPVANVPWRSARRPAGDYAEAYWDRWKTMGIDPQGLDWTDLAIRFAAFSTGAHTAIIGTRNLDHLKAAVRSVQAGPLAEDLVASIREAFRRHGQNWEGQV